MDPNRMTQRAQLAVQAARAEAIRLNQQQVDVEHLLLALLNQEDGLVARLLERVQVSVPSLRSRVMEELERRPKVSGDTEEGEDLHHAGPERAAGQGG
jgi:ATP-dependent Clp protease ATP-binding subunit ClpB